MSQPMDQAVAPPIEGIILANPRPDIPVEQLATLSEAERGLLSAIAGVEHMSFGITGARCPLSLVLAHSLPGCPGLADV